MEDVSLSNKGTSNEGAALSADERTVWFSALRPESMANGYDVFQASRADAADPFSGVTPVANVNTATDFERGPHMSPDGLRLYASIGGGITFKIVVAARDTPSASFGPLMPIPGADTTATEGGAYPVASMSDQGDRVLYYHSNSTKISSDGSTHIYRATVSESGIDPTVVEIFGLPPPPSTAPKSGPMNPVVTPGELVLYFALDNGANKDIWMARRSNVMDSFGNPEKLSQLSTDGDATPSWISDDNCVLYLTQGKSAPGYHISFATREMAP